MINLGIRRAMEFGAREVAWIDADVRPLRPPRQWFEETWHALQHYRFVQMYDSLLDLTLDGGILPNGDKVLSPGFVANYIKLGRPDVLEVHPPRPNPSPRPPDPPHPRPPHPHPHPYPHPRPPDPHPPHYHAYPYPHPMNEKTKWKFIGHPGGAWAADVQAINEIGGLPDYCILGAADHYLAYALVGSLRSVLGQKGESTSLDQIRWSDGHTRRLCILEDRCEHWIKRDIGYVSGALAHDFHGPKANRGYGDRWRILVDNAYDPDTDLKYDVQGLLQLETITLRQIRLRDQIRAYFAARNEDATH